MNTNNNPLEFEDHQQLLQAIRDEIHFNLLELQLPMADEDRLPYEEALRTAVRALADCE